MPSHYYSQRSGKNPHPKGLPFNDILDIFFRVYGQLRSDGYFDEAFGFDCVDAGHIRGTVQDPELAIFLAIRKKDLWPIDLKYFFYREDDLFDVLEFLFEHVSKPIDGTMHSWGECGMHWNAFDKSLGQVEYRKKVNGIFAHYSQRFELSADGKVLHKPEEGLEQIFEAALPTSDQNVLSRLDAAVRQYRRHGSTIDDRRHAVRDLADVLECLKQEVKKHLTKSDENDLFQIANQFGIRHHNDKQKTEYEASIWLSWMFYFYLSTIHVVLRKMELDTSVDKHNFSTIRKQEA